MFNKIGNDFKWGSSPVNYSASNYNRKNKFALN